MTLEGALLISASAIAFLILASFGAVATIVGTVAALIVSTACAVLARRLWLRQILPFDVDILDGLILIVALLWIFVDPLGWMLYAVFILEKYGSLGLLFSSTFVFYKSIIAIVLIPFVCIDFVLRERFNKTHALLCLTLPAIGPPVLLAVVSSPFLIFLDDPRNVSFDDGMKILILYLSPFWLAMCFLVVPAISAQGRAALVSRWRRYRQSVRCLRVIGTLARAQRARSHNELSESRRLLRAASEALEGASFEHPATKAMIWERWGTIDLALGDLAAGRLHLSAALDSYGRRARVNRTRILALQQRLGAVLVKLGDWPGAFAQLTAVEAGKRQLWGRHHPEFAAALVDLALVRRKLGDHVRAEASLKEALAIQRAALSRRSVMTAATLRDLGMLALETGDPAKAEGHLKEALAVERRVLGDHHPDVGQTLLGLACAREAVGDATASRAFAEDALRLALREDGITLRDVAFDLLSRIEARRGRLAGAIYFGKQAVNAVQRQRAGLVDLEPTLQQSFVTSKEAIYRHLIDLLVQTGRLGEAQQVLDLLKEQELSSFVLRNGAPRRPLSLLQLTRLEASWTRHGDEIADDLARLVEEERASNLRVGRDVARVAELRGRVDAANARLSAWLNTLVEELQSEHDTAQADSIALTVELTSALQGDLAAFGPEVVLLNYIVGQERLSIIVTTAERQVSCDVAVGAAALSALVDRFGQNLRVPGRDTTALRDLGHALYRHLVLPVEADLRGRSMVLVVLDGALRYLPFGALHDGRGYLLARHAFVMLTPACGRGLKADPQDWNDTGIGALGASKAEGHEALDAVRDELRAIVRQDGEMEGIYPGRRYLDDEFTAGALAEATAARAVIHIASHFTLQPAAAASSHLVLGDGTTLSLEDLGWLDFGGVDLVALAACETAAGSRGARSDGRDFESLGAVIQDRGAKAVLATLWAVEDRSTATLMTQFYRNRHRGLSKAAALREAQLTLMTGGPTMSTCHPDHAHPYFWAPFVLMGNWR